MTKEPQLETPTVKTPIDPSDLITAEELSARLVVKLSWIYEKTRRRGRITGTPLPVLGAGRFLRFSWSEVCEWMRANRVPKHTA